MTIGADDGSNQSVSMGNNTFTNNYAFQCGGVMRFIASIDSNQSFDMVNNTFTNNSAQQYGGVMYLYAQYSANQSISIGNNTFTNNSAQQDGGVMYLYADSYANQAISIGNNIFTNNSAQSGGVLYNQCLYLTNQSINMTMNTFDNNAGIIYSNTTNATYITLEEATISGSSTTTDIFMLDASNQGTIKLANIHLIQPSPDHFIGNITTSSAQFGGELRITSTFAFAELPLFTFNTTSQPLPFDNITLEGYIEPLHVCSGQTGPSLNATHYMFDFAVPCTPLPKIDPSTNQIQINLTGNFVLPSNETWNVPSGVTVVVTGCVLLEGQLNLTISPSSLPNTTQTLLQSTDKCIQGEFNKIQVDYSQNDQICSVEAQYSPSDVLMSLPACSPQIPPFPIGAVVGGVVGGVVLLVVVALLLVFLVKPIHDCVFPHHNRMVDMQEDIQSIHDDEKENRQMLGPDSTPSGIYDNQGRSGENELYVGNE